MRHHRAPSVAQLCGTNNPTAAKDGHRLVRANSDSSLNRRAAENVLDIDLRTSREKNGHGSRRVRLGSLVEWRHIGCKVIDDVDFRAHTNQGLDDIYRILSAAKCNGVCASLFLLL